jgi:hypothetical protein
MVMAGAILKRLCRIVIEMHLLSLVEDLELSLVGQYVFLSVLLLFYVCTTKTKQELNR